MISSDNLLISAVMIKKYSGLVMIAFAIGTFSCTQKQLKDDTFVLVEGGSCRNSKSNLYNQNISVADFYMGKFEVTQKEWADVMENNPSKFKGENLPMESVSWYECIVYCNKRSMKEGLPPFYHIHDDSVDVLNMSNFDSVKWLVTVDPNSNGYRLPTEVEWEYAASGGRFTKNYTYSGSDDIDEVAWYWKNSGDTILTVAWNWSVLQENGNMPHPSGQKKPNELGIYDMSGNVREWCQDWYQDIETKPGFARSQRGGGWMGAEYRCESSDRHSFEASGKGPDQGFRVCRSI
jgi:formylglycine-generating enzyme required for sulfatase activity